MSEDLMRYDLLAQRALRGIVRFALERAASEAGLPGEHHFYVAFATKAPGVSIPPHLAAEYPDEMRIVFKRQYWDLQVGPDEFSVTMSFRQQMHRLTVPFEAITSFFDPVVSFALAWPAPGATDTETSPPEPPPPQPDEPAPTAEPSEPNEGQVISLFRKK
jgi:hypothetical protein